MRVNKIQSRRGPPVSQQPWFDLLDLQRFPKQRIVEEINLSHRQIIGRTPVCVDQAEFFWRKRATFGLITRHFSYGWHGNLRPPGGKGYSACKKLLLRRLSHNAGCWETDAG